MSQVHPSPQRTPILFQAGSSPSGKAFAAKHAEAVFCGGGVPSDTAPFVKSVREVAAANGRGECLLTSCISGKLNWTYSSL